MPIGEKLYEERGRGSGMSLKDTHGCDAAIMDFTFTSEIQGFGRLKGVSGKGRATVEILAGTSGVANGVGRGFITLGKHEVVVWRRVGVNTIKTDQPVYVAIMVFETHSEKFRWMNNLICVVEGEIDADLDQIKRTVYEWKF